MVFLHPFDDPHLIAGYASMGLEILEDIEDVDKYHYQIRLPTD